MSIQRKREWAFFLLVVAIGVFVLYKGIRISWNSGQIDATIVQQRGGIATVDTPRKPLNTMHIKLERLAFDRGRMLKNAQYGKLGFTTNIFVDATTKMRVDKAGEYRFIVYSDDGFRLAIDGKTRCEHPGDRPYRATTCRVNLDEGTHTFTLHYFQGGGPMGLKVYYLSPGASKRRVVGEDSASITFERPR